MRPRGDPSIGKKLREILIRLKVDPEALHDLMAMMEDRLYKEAYHRLKDPLEAEGAVNYAFFKLWDKAHMYSEVDPALPYVLSVLRNYCRDIWRSERRKPKVQSLFDNCDLHSGTTNYTEELVIDLALNKKDAGVAKKICLDRLSGRELRDAGVSAERAREVIAKLKGVLNDGTNTVWSQGRAEGDTDRDNQREGEGVHQDPDPAEQTVRNLGH
jgi:DNA-directed RNA polymerase specialized sigma24 family protein